MEEVFSISQPWSLNGMWSGADNKDLPAVLFLSAGLLRSHGPNRLYVECARQLVSRGVSSLRFDLAGIGDSVERPNNAELEENTLAEVQEVIDTLSQQKGIDRFVLVGLCSGAYDAIEIAAQDDRVVGVVSLDGYSLESKWYKLHWFKRLVLPRLLQKRSWLKAIDLLNQKLGRAETDKRQPEQVDLQVATESLFLESKPPEKILEQFTQLLSREVSLLCLFTGGVIDEYSYRGQLADAAPALANNPHMREVYYPEVDHLLMIDEDRKKVVNTVVEHILSIK